MKTRALALIASAAFLAPTANAGFHLFDIQEVFSNFDGSIQFIELLSISNSQQFVGGQTLRLEVASPVSTLNTFTFPSDGPSPTANKTYLIGTSNLTALFGVTPDFILPANFLQVGTGFSNKRINFAGGIDVVNLLNLPLNGVGSLNGITTNATSTVTSVNAQATPTNFIGQTASIPEPVTAGLVGLGVLALLRRRRS